MFFQRLLSSVGERTRHELLITDKELSTESLDGKESLMRGFKIVQDWSCHSKGSPSAMAEGSKSTTLMENRRECVFGVISWAQ